MIPYSRQIIGNTDVKSVIKVLKIKFLTQGSVIKKFEKAISKKFKSKYVVSMNSTSALHVACLALGIKKRI